LPKWRQPPNPEIVAVLPNGDLGYHSATLARPRLTSPGRPSQRRQDSANFGYSGGDGFAEFQGGGCDVLHLPAEAARVLVYFWVAAPEGFEPVEFRLKFVDLL
jgi:hypothetical protein